MLEMIILYILSVVDVIFKCLLSAVFFFALYRYCEKKALAEKKQIKIKKFTFLDELGNPSIRIEDLPEIIDFLYRLENKDEKSE